MAKLEAADVRQDIESTVCLKLDNLEFGLILIVDAIALLMTVIIFMEEGVLRFAKDGIPSLTFGKI